MVPIRSVLFLGLVVAGGGRDITGNFWHITDLHWDPTYDLTSESVCRSSGDLPTPHAGKFGDYNCDSPWDLISSSLHAMKNILPDPDFIVWTGCVNCLCNEYNILMFVCVLNHKSMVVRILL